MTDTEIKAARTKAKQTQAEAAKAVSVTTRTWQRYEAGTTKMPAGLWQLYQLLVK